MMDPNVSKSTDHRERVATFLTFLASDRARDALTRCMDHDRLVFELCRIWFDAIYVPSRRYFDGLKGDYSEEAAQQFRDAFTDDELSALERFNRFLELRIEMVSKEALASGRIPLTDGWESLIRHAHYLLDDLEPDSAYRLARLGEHIGKFEFTDSTDVERLLGSTVIRREG